MPSTAEGEITAVGWALGSVPPPDVEIERVRPQLRQVVRRQRADRDHHAGRYMAAVQDEVIDHDLSKHYPGRGETTKGFVDDRPSELGSVRLLQRERRGCTMRDRRA